MTVLALATALAAAISEHAAGSYPGVCQFLASDAPSAAAYLVAAGDRVVAVEGRHRAPDLTVTAPSDAYAAMAAHRLALRDQAQMRRIQLAGDLRMTHRLLGRFLSLLDAARRDRVVAALRATAEQRIAAGAAWSSQVRAVEAATLADLRAARSAREPVRFPGLARGWDLVQAGWAALRRDHGDLVIFASPTRTPPEVTLAAWIDLACGGGNHAPVPGTGGMRLPEALVGERDRAAMRAVASSATAQRLLWIGQAGSITPLHRDLADGTIIQLVGVKEWTMFPPEHAAYLAVAEDETDLSGTGYQPCRADAYGRNADVYPSFARARSATFTLRPGDALLVPSGWFHAVRAVEPSISVTL